jgi:hypothetical protein
MAKPKGVVCFVKEDLPHKPCDYRKHHSVYRAVFITPDEIDRYSVAACTLKEAVQNFVTSYRNRTGEWELVQELVTEKQIQVIQKSMQAFGKIES